MIYTVFMPMPDGSLRCAISLRAMTRDAAYDLAIELTGIPGAGATVSRAPAGPGCYLLSRKR